MRTKSIFTMMTMSSMAEFEETPVGISIECKRCKKVFSSKRELLLHKKEVHYQNKASYECKLCAKFFCNSGNLERHMKVHNDVRPFVCRICEKAFAQAVNLTRHYTVHNGERPFACNFCEKAFTQQSNLTRHMLTHTGQKPFRCKRCGRYFSQRVNLKKHIMGHINAKPYACKICLKTFIQLANYKRHLQSHIKVGVPIDVNAAVQEAAQLARLNLEVSQHNFECAICHTVFHSFPEFEQHDERCSGKMQHVATAQQQQSQPQLQVREPAGVTQLQQLPSHEYKYPPLNHLPSIAHEVKTSN